MLAKVPPTSFITNKLTPMEKPFDGYWAPANAGAHKPKTGRAGIYISPTKVVDPLTTAEGRATNQVSREYARGNHAESYKLAARLDAQLKVALAQYAGVVVVSSPTEASYTMQLAIVDLGSTKVAANVAGVVAGQFVPGAGMLAKATSNVYLVVAGKVSHNGQLIAEFADYLQPSTSLLSGNDYMQYGAHRSMIDDWARLLAKQLSHKGDGTLESKGLGFKLFQMPTF